MTVTIGGRTSGWTTGLLAMPPATGVGGTVCVTRGALVPDAVALVTVAACRWAHMQILERCFAPYAAHAAVA